MLLKLPRSAAAVLQLIFACVLLLCTAVVCVRTFHWPLQGDSSLIHYVVFLMDSGLKPYKDIKAVNLPGAIFIDWLIIHLLGPGALAERIYDLLVCLAALLAMLYLCPRRLRFAGLFAGLMFFLIHARDGAVQLGQRDLNMAVLSLLAFVFSFAAMRSETSTGMRSGWTSLYLLSGLCLGAAAIIKPVAILLAIPLVAGQWPELRKRHRRSALPSALLLFGLSLPIALTALWLAGMGALKPFLAGDIPRLRYYSSAERLPFHLLIARGISPLLAVLILGLVLLPFAWKRLRSREFAVLCGAVLTAFLAFLIQGKGFAYHRYSFLAFLLLVLGIVFVDAVQYGGRWQRWTALAALGGACFITAPLATARAVAYQPQFDQFGTLLTADLDQIGLQGLQGNVECLDDFSGCLRILYDLRLRQSTGNIYDEFLFGPSADPVIIASRASFARQIAAHPPEVFILTPQVFADGPDTYEKIDRWPAFAEYLSQNYRLYAQRTPTRPQWWEGSPRVPIGYRIYLRKTP